MIFQQPIKKRSSRVLQKFFQLIPAQMRHWVLEGFIRAEANEPAKDALRSLLHLDSLIYKMAGLKSIEYNNGRHIKHRVTGYHEFFISRVNKNERVIDIGCGRGEVAYEIAKKTGGFVVGIDNNEKWLNYARQNYQHRKLRFILEDAEKYLPSNKFNTVILSNVLEHIENRISFLQKIISHIQPSRFLIRVPMFNRDWRVPLKKELGLTYYLDDTHHIEYTQESFVREMTAAGLYLSYLKICWGEIWAELVPDNQNKSLNDS